MICEKCKKEIPDNANFCIHCGNQINQESTNNCPKCGKEFDDTTVFCTSCGEKVGPVKKNPQKIVITRVEQKETVHKSTNPYRIAITILALLTIGFGLLASITPVILNNASGLNTVASSVNLYSIIEYMINQNKTSVLMNIIPAVILCATSITIIICFIFALIKSIQILSDPEKDADGLNKIFSIFVIAFFIMYFTSTGYVVHTQGHITNYDYVTSPSQNPLCVFTIMLIVALFITKACTTIANNKKNNISNQQVVFRIINFVLLLVVISFTNNSYIQYSSDFYFSGLQIQYHPIGYFITTYWKAGNPSVEVGVYASTNAIAYAWIYFLSYMGLIIMLSLNMAKVLTFKEQSNKNTIVSSILLGLFGLVFFITQMMIVANNSSYQFNGAYTGFLTIIIVVVLFNILFIKTNKKEINEI